jgi:hypothetical protein
MFHINQTSENNCKGTRDGQVSCRDDRGLKESGGDGFCRFTLQVDVIAVLGRTLVEPSVVESVKFTVCLVSDRVSISAYGCILGYHANPSITLDFFLSIVCVHLYTHVYICAPFAVAYMCVSLIVSLSPISLCESSLTLCFPAVTINSVSTNLLS